MFQVHFKHFKTTWQAASGWKSTNIAAALKPVLHSTCFPHAKVSQGALLWFLRNYELFWAQVNLQYVGARPRRSRAKLPNAINWWVWQSAGAVCSLEMFLRFLCAHLSKTLISIWRYLHVTCICHVLCIHPSNTSLSALCFSCFNKKVPSQHKTLLWFHHGKKEWNIEDKRSVSWKTVYFYVFLFWSNL